MSRLEGFEWCCQETQSKRSPPEWRTVWHPLVHKKRNSHRLRLSSSRKHMKITDKQRTWNSKNGPLSNNLRMNLKISSCYRCFCTLPCQRNIVVTYQRNIVVIYLIKNIILKHIYICNIYHTIIIFPWSASVPVLKLIPWCSNEYLCCRRWWSRLGKCSCPLPFRRWWSTRLPKIPEELTKRVFS